jgi:translation elongation factor EF-1beta
MDLGFGLKVLVVNMVVKIQSPQMDNLFAFFG